MHTTSAAYKLLLFALSPVALGYLTYRSLKDGGWRYFKQRLGFGYSSDDTQPIHLHCASVGEFITAKPLLESIYAKYPNKHFIVTTNTPTAASLVDKLSYKNLTHYYLPIDLSFSVKRFLKKINPLCTIILETEIWPTYFSHAYRKAIPIVIVNARLSKKTYNTKKIIKNEYTRALKNVNLVLARSQADHDKFLLLGAAEKITHTIGNLKYATSHISNQELACTTIKRPFFLAASTHDDEEVQLCQYIELLKRRNYLLVLAPRYPDRCKQLMQQLRLKGINVALRSVRDSITDSTDVYIIDTLGELNVFYNEAALVFVGGSLISRGGHNVLEPAHYGKCIIVGPHTDNFALETSELLTANALIQVDDSHQLGVQLIDLLNNDAQREAFGKNAREFIGKQTNILNKYLQYLEPVFETAK